MTTPTTKARAKPQDHQKPAAQREVEGDETIEIEYAGNVYVLPASADDWSFVTAGALENGQFFKFLEAVLGDQFETFLATNPTNGQAVELFNEYAAALGMPKQGE